MKDFLQVFVVPPEINENDEDGYIKLGKLANGFHIPTKDKVLIDQILKEFMIHEFPKILVFDEEGIVVSSDGIDDILTMDLEKIRRKWNRDMNAKLIDED